MQELTLDIDDRPPGGDLIDRIAEGLDAGIPNGVPDYAPIPLTLVLKDADATIQGALTGQSVWHWFYVNLLWIAKDRQSGGLGTRLMHAAETEAKRRHCTGIWVSTYSFQAPAFYQKLGYEPFGHIENFPKGFVRHFFRKRLD